MRLHRAVPKIPAKSSVPPELPFNKSRLFLTRSESTLPQVLIPLHFNSSRINTYKKRGGGCPSSSPKVLQLVTTPTPPSFHRRSPLVYPRAADGPLSPLESHSLHTPTI